jgi:RNA polymerase sigma factor for flagellar operon FliA
VDREATERVESNVKLAEIIASRYAIGLPSHIDRDAIKGAAYEGLCRAAISYDAKAGPFRPWAIRKIVSRIRDEVRSMDHLTRTQRAKLNPEHARYDPSFKIGADPAAPSSLDDPHILAIGGGNDDVTLIEKIPDVHAVDPGERFQMTRDDMFVLLSGLPDKEFRVMTLRYFGGMSITNIARSMDLSPSRISQLETIALQRMRREIT